MLKSIFKWVSIFLILIVAISLFYKKVYIPKITYSFITAKKGDLNISIFGIGTVEAKYIYPISSTYGGRVLEIYKDEGDRVEKGELIAKIDTVDLPTQLSEAKFGLKKAQMELKSLQEEKKSLYAKRELAQTNFDIYKRLYQKSFTSKQNFDKAKTDLDSIKAEIDSLEYKIKASKEDIKRLNESINALKERLSRYEIYSPISGVVISKDANRYQNIAPQQAIITIVKPQDIWIKIYIDERISDSIRVGDVADITLRSKANSTLKGVVARVEPQSDPITEERVIDIKLNKALKSIHLHEQAEANIYTKSLKNITLIPAKVIRDGGVWVYQDSKAHFKKVEILGREANTVAVDGVKEGEKILIPNPHKKSLKNGATVRL